ncbi:MAG: hypothetical protein JXB42_13610, partial [Deltaproteobacteria bacterium]|nr:hypothetical protein [Deltaproteobacteria bacterium]
MNDSLTIRDLRKSVIGDFNEVSADVDGDRVFFRTPRQYEIDARSEPFLGIALLEAMIRNVDIRIEDSIPLSERLYEKLPEIQAVYACWNEDLRRVSIHARIDPCKDNYERVASFFSAGVDGLHTLLRKLTDITHLIMLSDFEPLGNPPGSWQQAVEKQTVFARSLGKELIPVETNAKHWTDQRKISFEFAQGLILSSMGPMLKAKRLFIASSHTYNELFPWGTHPLSDPMWSTESTAVIHDGAGSRRGEKMRDLCQNQMFLDNLKVCWRSPSENCGECAKCIRTMVALYLLGASSKALPAFDDKFARLKILQASDETGVGRLDDLMVLARNARNKKVYGILLRLYLRYHLR